MIQSPLKGDSEWTNISLDQFKNYISTIDNLSELRYIFNAKKLSTEQAKTGMKAFLNNATNKQAVWNSMKPELKNSLELDDISDLTESKIAEMVDVFVETI